MMPSSRLSLDSDSSLGMSKATRQHNKEKYESLSDEADITLLNEQIKRQRSGKQWSTLMIGLCVSFIVVSISAITYLSVKLDRAKAAHDDHPTIMRTGAELGDCGHNIAEARAAGCIFDPMSWLWVAPACYHKEMTEEWINRTDWHFYTDVEMQPKDEVSVESAYNGDYQMLYTPYKYHKIHCSYMWLKTHKTMKERLPIDTNMMNEHHLHHCQMVLLNEFFHQDVNCTNTADYVCPIRLSATYTKCGYF